VRMRAAVLEDFGKPLVVSDVELGAPRPGEALVRLEACGVCHTDLYTASGVDPSGYAPTVLGHEGAGVVEALGEGVSSLSVGDHVVTLFAPQCKECLHCTSMKTNICLAIRDQQNQGYLPDGTTRLSRDGEPIRHFMGTSTFAQYTVMPEIALARISPEAPLDRACLCLRVVDRPGSGDVHGHGRAGLDVRGVRRGHGRPRRGRGLSSAGRRAHHRCRPLDAAPGARPPPRRHRSDGGRRRRGEAHPRADRRFGADYTFEATGRVEVMAQAVEAARMGWGLCTVAGVAGRGETLDIIPRWLITGRRVCGASFGGVRGRDQVPELVERYLAGDIDVDSFISHRIGLQESTAALSSWRPRTAFAASSPSPELELARGLTTAAAPRRSGFEPHKPSGWRTV